MSSMCSNASSKKWTLLLDRFIKELLICANRPPLPAAMLPSMAQSVSVFCNNLF